MCWMLVDVRCSDSSRPVIWRSRSRWHNASFRDLHIWLCSSQLCSFRGGSSQIRLFILWRWLTYCCWVLPVGYGYLFFCCFYCFVIKVLTFPPWWCWFMFFCYYINTIITHDVSLSFDFVNVSRPFRWCLVATSLSIKFYFNKMKFFPKKKKSIDIRHHWYHLLIEDEYLNIKLTKFTFY